MTPNVKPCETLAVDAANGIGAQKLIYVNQQLPGLLHLEIFNDGTRGHLNEKVKEQRTS